MSEAYSAHETVYAGPEPEGRPLRAEASPQDLEQIERDLRRFMVHVFGWIAGALFLCAFFASYSDDFEFDLPSMLTDNVIFLLIGGMIGLTYLISRKAGKMMPSVAMATLVAYAAVQGILFGFAYRGVYGASLAPIYLILTIVFGGLAVYGMRSGVDLTSTRTLFIGGLAVSVPSIVLVWIVDLPTISVCTACVACWLMLSLVGYHRDLLRDLPASFENDPKWEKAAAVGALQICLDLVIIVVVVIQGTLLRDSVAELTKREDRHARKKLTF